MFDVDPSQIEALDAKGLVLLLRRLLHAEARATELPLSAVSVPLQITVPDGGEDGRIAWTGGRGHTDYLPGRITYFQCKATKLGRRGWMKECWVKSTQRKGKTRKLTPAMISLIEQAGCYVGFTTEALTGEKRDDYVRGIREAIDEAGGDPTKLAAIDVYDANQIADWATRHPAVAIWLAENAQRQSLAGFGTVESWGSRSDFANAYARDNENRYAIGSERTRDSSGDDNRTNAKVAWARILEHITQSGTMVRVVGTSGLGKSRFVYESLKASPSLLSTIVRNSTVFAEYKVVSTVLLPVATHLSKAGHRTLLVVDECPRDVAIELGRLAG